MIQVGADTFFRAMVGASVRIEETSASYWIIRDGEEGAFGCYSKIRGIYYLAEEEIRRLTDR